MNAIVSVDEHWGIGKENNLLFRIPADMQFFKEKTMGKVVVMGKNTLLSFPNGPLKNRINILLSSSEKREDCKVFSSVSALLAELKKYPKEDVFVIGGAKVYELLLSYCNEIFVTKVFANGNADAFFPNLDQDSNFIVTEKSEVVETNGYRICFYTYENQSVSQL